MLIKKDITQRNGLFDKLNIFRCPTVFVNLKDQDLLRWYLWKWRRTREYNKNASTLNVRLMHNANEFLFLISH